MTDKAKKRLGIIFAAVVFVILAAGEIYSFFLGFDEDIETAYQIVSRLLGGFLFLYFIAISSFNKILTPPAKRIFAGIVFALPCFVVVINNFPFYPYFTGRAEITGSTGELLIWALTCLSVGFFEEMVFRGGIFLILLENARKIRRNIFFAIVKSSVLFGLIHLINLFFGASPGYVLLQTGYSFLIGGMCAVVLLKTHNLWLCVVLHSIFNFSGGLIPELGEGVLWDAPTVIVTVVIALIATAYIIRTLIKINTDELDGIFRIKTNKEVKNGNI